MVKEGAYLRRIELELHGTFGRSLIVLVGTTRDASIGTCDSQAGVMRGFDSDLDSAGDGSREHGHGRDVFGHG